ncbi:MAG: zinc ABC transporter substrate-binding protein [Oscillospiraceae bacterium]|jgi:zinc transport system substrate-binding protein|nr:zinc ABC transporter substrate-binding protein [Oscillospiraceae bacterium]
MKRVPWLCLTLAACLALVGCAPAPVAAPQELVVVTSFYPIYVLTLNVTRGVPGVTVRNMAAPQAGCLHEYQLLPGDMQTLAQAGVFIINGAGMESFLDRTRAMYPDLPVIEAARDIPLLHGNPHVWVDPLGAAAQVRAIAAGLADVDPSHAADYEANGEAYAARLEALCADMRAKLADVTHRDIVTFHEAFPYFARALDLRVVAVIEREPGSEPTPLELVETVRAVREAGATALFAEPQYASDAAAIIARETGARVYTLDPVVTGPLEPDAYERAMERNLAALQEALR